MARLWVHAVARLILTCMVFGVAHAAPRSLTSDIAELPLAQALSEFAAQTGLQVVYVSELAQGRTSHKALSGSAPREALTQLLTGTGLEFVFLNARTVKIFAGGKAISGPAPASGLPQRRQRAPELDEIVITATKREELLNGVPISVSVISGMEIDAREIKTVGDIAAVTPGVEYDFSSQWGPGILTNLAVRGINSNVGSATTGVYIDDVPIQARNGNFGNPYPVLFDLARVEVLRGPQGTLFGASAEGGAMRFISNDPDTTNAFERYHMEFARNESGGLSFESGLAAAAPLTQDRFGVRVSAWYREDGGYVDHVDPLNDTLVEKNANRDFGKAVKLAFALSPLDAVLITPSIAYQSVAIHDTPTFFDYLSDLNGGVLRNGKLLRQPAADSFSLASVKLEARLESAKIVFVSAYFDRNATSTVDTTNDAGVYYYGGFGNPLGPAFPTSYDQAVPTSLTLHQSVLSEEARVTSDNDTRLQWVGGVFYSRARQTDDRDTYTQSLPAAPGFYSDVESTDSLLAVFGNLEAAWSRRWSTSLGLRVDHATSDFTEQQGGFAFPDLPAFSHAVTRESPLTPRLTMTYHALDQGILYATLGKGYRIGGINVALPPECSAGRTPRSYASDSLWSRELGAKFSLLDNHVRVDASLFDIDWTHIQEQVVYDCGFGYVANAGAARSKGFDFSGQLKLSQKLGLDLAFSSVDVRYTKTIFNLAGEVIEDRGTVVGGAPSVPAPWSGTLAAHYQGQLSRNVRYYLRAEDIVHSRNPGPFTETDPRAIGYDPRIHGDPAMNQLNVQWGLLWNRLNIRLFLNNALNEQPQLQRSADAPGSGLIYEYTLRPRTIGVSINWASAE